MTGRSAADYEVLLRQLEEARQGQQRAEEEREREAELRKPADVAVLATGLRLLDRIAGSKAMEGKITKRTCPADVSGRSLQCSSSLGVHARLGSYRLTPCRLLRYRRRCRRKASR